MLEKPSEISGKRMDGGQIWAIKEINKLAAFYTL